MSAEMRPDGQHFSWYLASLGAASLALGIQVVIFPWLVVGVLNETPDRLGFAQMMMLLPTLLLILVGGALSDQRHAGDWVSRLYLVYLLPVVWLLVLVWMDWLSYPMLVLYGMGFGIMSALVQPARESMLVQIAVEGVQTAVARAAVIQFLLQGVGMLLAGQMDVIPWEALVVFQGIMFLIAAVSVKRSGRKLAPVRGGPEPLSMALVTSGLRLVADSRLLSHLMVTSAANGFLGLGIYVVALPLLTRDVYAQSAAFYATLQLLFTGGIVITNLLMSRARYFQWPGRWLGWTLLLRGLIILLIGFHLPTWMLYLSVLGWGLLSGISMTLGRTMVHENTLRDSRARVLSVYQLALFGMAPLGAWVCGVMVAWQDVLVAMRWLGLMALLAALWTIASRELWRATAAPEMPATPPSPLH